MNMTYESFNQEQLIKQHLPLVKQIASRLMFRLPANIEQEDLIQVGLMGLLDAAKSYDANHQATFKTYASQRIRGAMLDELRQLDWQPRMARKQMREIEKTIRHLEQQLMRPPTEAEIARKMSMSLEEYQEYLQEASGHQLLYYEDFNNDDYNFLEMHADDNIQDPLKMLANANFREALVNAIPQLPEREQLLLSLYYEQGLNLREIGAILDITESRVCQIHTQAISRIRAKLERVI